MTRPGLVIFDCDGVLVDSMPIDMRELTRAIEDVGGMLEYEDVRDLFSGLPLPDIEAAVVAHLGRPLPDGWMARYLARRADAFERELQPVPGAGEAVAAVRALGWETCVASGGSVQKMEQTLRVSGLAGVFPDERIFSASMVARGKPAPDVFLHAAAACGFDPGACVVVEDSVPGVKAGCDAGMRTLAYVGADDVVAARAAALGAELLPTMHELSTRL